MMVTLLFNEVVSVVLESFDVLYKFVTYMLLETIRESFDATLY